MNDRVMQRRVGILVLAAFTLGALLVGLNSSASFSWLPWGPATYPIHVEVDQAPGVAANTPVRKNGLLIGRVSTIRDLPDRVVITAEIYHDVELFPQYTCQVRTTMLGDSTVEFFRAPVPPNSAPLPPDSNFRANVFSSNPLDMVSGLQGDLSRTIVALGRAGEEVSTLGERINQILSDEQGQERIGLLLDKGLLALDQFSGTMQSVEDVFGDEESRRNIKEGAAGFPVAVQDLRVTLRDIQELLNSIDVVMESVDAVVNSADGVVSSAERNLKNLEGFTEPMGRNGEQIVQSVVSGAEGIEHLLEEVTVFTRALTNRDGTIGKLINDSELYDNINQLAMNSNSFVWRINQLTNQLSPSLRKLVVDASIFADKIAREPGRLVGGALNRGPGIK